MDFNFFGFELGGCVHDTPVCTDMLDEIQVNGGKYDDIFIDLDTEGITNNTARPDRWTMTTIMNAEFEGNLDAGSIGGNGFKVTNVQLYRTIAGIENWQPIATFEYNEDFNVYSYIDRYVSNGTEYRYALVPIANQINGEMLKSDTIKSEYEGIFLTDRNENRRFEYDIVLGDIVYNQSFSISQPINGAYPIVVFGNSKYRSSNLSVLPLSRSTVEMAGGGIDKIAEQVNRQEWLDFINNGKAKVLRMDSGLLALVVTHEATITHKEGQLKDLASISFNYTEIGELNFENIVRNALVSGTYTQKSTFDDFGGVISG